MGLWSEWAPVVPWVVTSVSLAYVAYVHYKTRNQSRQQDLVFNPNARDRKHVLRVGEHIHKDKESESVETETEVKIETKTEHKCDHCGDIEVEEQSPDGRPHGRRSAYSLFVAECADKEDNHLCRTKSDRRVFAEFAKKCAHIWKKLSEEEKQRYHRLSEDDKDRYDREIKAFRDNRKKSRHSPRKSKSSKAVSNGEETTSTVANDSLVVPDDTTCEDGIHCHSVPEEPDLEDKANSIEIESIRQMTVLERKLSEPRNKMIKFMSVEEPEPVDDTDDRLLDMAFDMWATEEMPSLRHQRPSIGSNDEKTLTELLSRWDRSVPQEVKCQFLERARSFDKSFNKSIRDEDEESAAYQQDNHISGAEECLPVIDGSAEDCAQSHSKSSKV